jgi:predicted lipoprotein with Yx(FWY)xxD motif
MRVLPAVAFLVSALVLGACGAQRPAPSATQSEPDSAAGIETAPEQKAERRKPEKPPPGTEIALGDSQFGEMLFDTHDQAIYLFDKETGDKSECYDDCAAAWPPVLTKGEPLAGKGIEQSLLGTTKRKDGTTQVTYNGHPLYFYANEGPGEVKCHNVVGFGGTWLVLGANGDALPG